MKVAIASGKGGTGKTTVAVNLACVLADNGHTVQYLDCDVEEPNGHIFLKPRITSAKPVNIPVPLGRREEIYGVPQTPARAAGCVWSCSVKPMTFAERLSSEWFVSETRYGPMVQVRLIPGGENSDKLVSKVREVTRAVADERKADLILVDGPPGIGCPVIASVTGASQVPIVTSPYTLRCPRHGARSRANTPLLHPCHCVHQQVEPEPRANRTDRIRGPSGRRKARWPRTI
ncbi:MAG: nucleotide-binding protein [Kiritimatiellia bacterium]